MTTPDPNRKSPDFAHYNQLLADVIAVFWQFHRERVEANNIPFAAEDNIFLKSITPFDPRKEIDQPHTEGDTGKFIVIESYFDSVQSTLRWSWEQFLRPFGCLDTNPFSLLAPVPKQTERFFQAGYVYQLISEAGRLGKTLSEIANDSRNSDQRPMSIVQHVVNSGMRTGSAVPTQLVALFGQDFNVRQALVLSKVRLNDISQARKEIGLPSLVTKPTFRHHAPSYGLIDDSPLGLNKNKLKEYGLGDAIGCPAGMKASRETRRFLLTCGVDVGRITMLEDFAHMLAMHFDTVVGEWYRELSPEARMDLIDEEDLAILNGEARSGAINHCRAARA